MTTLRALLGDYPHTRSLLRGEISAPGLTLDFAQISGRLPFKDFVRHNKFDLGEMPLIPLLQARELGKPFWLLPVVLTSRFQHGSFYVRADSRLKGPGNLAGRRVALRSDANTGVAWALGILAEEYGVGKTALNIVTFEDNHIAEFVSPPNVERAPPGKDMVQMLIDGEVDAIVTEADLARESQIRALIPDAATVAQRWYERHQVVHAGHVVAISGGLSEAPALVREIFELFRKSKVAALRPGELDLLPQGIDNLRGSVARMSDYALQQGLIKRPLPIEDLCDETTRTL